MQKLKYSLILLLFFIVPLTTLAQESGPQVHIIQADDTLSALSEKYLGSSKRYPEIVEATTAKRVEDDSFADIQDVNLIEVGDKLLIPANNADFTPPIVEAEPDPETKFEGPPPSGKIAFSFWNPAAERCTYEINVIDVEACLTNSQMCQAKRQIFSLNNASEPALSPDGEHLTYRGWGTIPDTYNGEPHPYRDCAKPMADPWIQTVATDGTDVRQITGFLEDSHPDWSPDGSRIIFDTARNGDGVTRIMFMYANTTGEDPRGPHAEDLRIAGQFPSWAPDNEQFVYRGCDLTGNQCGLWIGQARPVFAADTGTNMLNVVVEGSELTHPDWSPISDQIAYQNPVDGNWDIYVINADGTEPRRLTDDSHTEGLPTWAPDGSWIAYLSDAGGSWSIWIMRSDGTEKQLLFAYDGGNYTPFVAVHPYGSRSWIDEQISWSK
ncbi:hypothetical protein QUF64_02370 [Anaerolineales bacterium HSG6]|nr:hypothetical protein [Anaerolineales bacterium HSG6]